MSIGNNLIDSASNKIKQFGASQQIGNNEFFDSIGEAAKSMSEEAKISLDDIGIDVDDGKTFKFSQGKDAGLDFKSLQDGRDLKSYEIEDPNDLVEARQDLFGNDLERRMGLRNKQGEILKGGTSNFGRFESSGPVKAPSMFSEAKLTFEDVLKSSFVDKTMMNPTWNMNPGAVDEWGFYIPGSMSGI